MSSWKKAAKSTQRTHRERHQPENRAFLGLLEKKKDYIQRAKDNNEKQATLKLLRKRALNKNPDEFYFHMINSNLNHDGVHKEKIKDENYTDAQVKLMKTQDLKYIAFKRNLERKKVEKLHQNLHMIDMANEIPNTHTFFVDTAEDVKNFDISKKLDTHPALIGRRTNRPKLSSLEKMKLPNLDESHLKKIEKQKISSYRELGSRVDRERDLLVVQQTLEIQKALKDKTALKPKRVVPGSNYNAPVYKWKYERKK